MTAAPSREERVAMAFHEREDRLARAIAEQWGTPAFAQQAPRAEELDIWDARSATATAAQFKAAGMPEEQVATLVAQYGDEIPVDEQGLLALGMPVPQVARLVYQERYRMIPMDGRVRLKDQIAWCERMAAASAKRMAEGMADHG